MATREQIEQEAYELYPESYDAETGHHVDDWGFSECQREAHVRAKTLTAEQVEKAAAYDYDRHGQDCPTPWEDAPDYLRSRYRAYAREQFRAAGFYVEGEE